MIITYESLNVIADLPTPSRIITIESLQAIGKAYMHKNEIRMMDFMHFVDCGDAQKLDKDEVALILDKHPLGYNCAPE